MVSRGTRGPAHTPLPGCCCCLLRMDVIWYLGQFKMKIVSTSEGRLSLKVIIFRDQSKYLFQRQSLFPSYCENNACSLHLGHCHLPQERLLLQTQRRFLTQAVHRACVATTRYVCGLRRRALCAMLDNEVHYAKRKIKLRVFFKATK